MTTPTPLPPELIRIVREVLHRELPDFELVSAELPRAQTMPPETADRGRDPLLSPSPPLVDLQDHFKSLGFGQPSRQLPEPRAPEADEHAIKEPGLVHCRIRPRDAVEQEAAEIDILISVTGQTVVGM